VQLSEATAEAYEIARSLHGLQLRSDPRSRVALACFAVAQQHHSAILILLANSPPLQATAFALLRPLLEATLRGEWVSHCATDEQVKTFALGGKKQLDMASVVSELGKKVGNSNAHSVLYKNTWPIVSAYTHTFEHQIQHWLSSSGISPNYSTEQVVWLVSNASACMKLCSASIQSLSLPAQE
jgi:hypothetical protein